jgi:peptide/nickel transport system substrate-binding protein
MRAVALLGSATAAAALLAACGGAEDGEQQESSGLVSEPVDTTKNAKQGGILRDRTFADPPTLDIYTPNNPLNAMVVPCYSSLVQYKPGYLRPSDNEIIPDLAESWEQTPDGLQIVMKLRQGVRWHNKPPVDGRAFDVDDVLFTWDRFSRKSTARVSVANSVNPDAPIVSITATDPKTIVVKLAEPIVYGLVFFAINYSDGVMVIPKETDTTFDIRSDLIGTGPFYLSNYTPSVGFTLKRHESHYERAWLEQIDSPIISEYSAALGQLRAGNLYSMGTYRGAAGVTPEDILPLKREEPRISIYQGDFRGAGDNLYFGWLPEGQSVFLDERVRQAISMAIDRELFMDTFLNVSNFRSEGLPVETWLNTHLPASRGDWWLDPRGKNFGPGARFFEHNLTEAKKLLAAAGYPNGFDAVSNYVTGPQIGVPRHKEVTDAFITELGIKVTVNSIDYLKEYAPKYRDGKGQFEGWAYTTTAGGAGKDDPLVGLANEYWSKSGAASFRGFSTSGKNDLSGDPQVDALFEKARLERDTDKRKELVHEIQRYLAKPMYAVPSPGLATSFDAAWPCIGNFNVWHPGAPGGRRIYHLLWLDQSRPPISNT